MRLSEQTQHLLSSDVARPDYARKDHKVGILHFGIGAFHRAHEAVYTDAALAAGDSNWRIVGVSLRSTSAHEKLAPQDSLYTVTKSSRGRSNTRLIGAVSAVLVGAEDAESITELIADPAVAVLSFTVTEKGYHLSGSGALDVHARPVAVDLSGGRPQSIYGFLKHGLRRRCDRNAGGVTLLSCDNVPDNGTIFRDAILDFLLRTDAGLASWFERECVCPSTMVDRIVPATTAGQVDALERRIGLRDEAAVFTEPFSQWVIEDRFAGRRPRWDSVGAQFVTDVRVYDAAKLRMLNGAHSALAYLGLERGYEFVHEAISDPVVREAIETIMLHEAARSLPDNFEAQAYGERLMERFTNPALEHRLAQIAMDGSQKIPQRWLATLAYHQKEGSSCPGLLRALAAWLRHVRGDRRHVDDPMARQLKELWRKLGAAGIVPALFGNGGIFKNYWVATEEDQAWLRSEVEH